jgi:hypothetical protein
VIDALSVPLGAGASRLLNKGIFFAAGLRAADRASIHGVTGRLFGAYAPYIPRHASDFVGYNQAVQFFAHPTPVLAQVGGRTSVNVASCNGGDVTPYCG